MKGRNLKVNVIDKQDNVNNQIKKFLEQEGVIVYGARSINAQTGIITRPTDDWDAFSSKPKQSADKLQKKLDKIVKGDYFYSKPAMHKGTWKVMGLGDDMKPGTIDDEGIADFSSPEKKIPFRKINRIKYRLLKEEIKAKKKSLADKEMKFRNEKDRGDLNRIKANLKIKTLLN